MAGLESKQTEQRHGVPWRRRLPRKNPAAQYSEVGVGEVRSPVLKYVVERRPRRGNLLEELRAQAVNGARVTEVSAYPLLRRQRFARPVTYRSEERRVG